MKHLVVNIFSNSVGQMDLFVQSAMKPTTGWGLEVVSFEICVATKQQSLRELFLEEPVSR